MNQNLMALNSALMFFLANCAKDDEAIDIAKMFHNKILELENKRKDAKITEAFNAIQAVIKGWKG